MTTSNPTLPHLPREQSASIQNSLPSRYKLSIQIFSLAAFTLAFLGWLNESWLFWFESPIWLNRYTEYAIILGFGLWRIQAEQNPYTRRRLKVLVAVVTIFWWLIPWLWPFVEIHLGYLWVQPVFPAIHTPGTVTFFVVLALVLLFGRRVVCGWGCPCVGIRETVGFPFRHKTVRGKWAWRLRHTKWFFFTGYMMVLVATLASPTAWSVKFVGLFYLLVALTYFGTFFIAPLVGNRFYCRYFCPFGATFGVLNHLGFYDIKMDKSKCIECKRCEQVCDMGIPVQRQGKEFGQITGIEDCMGCARCVVSCPTNALEIRDVRNVFRASLRQDASHLLQQGQPIDQPREDAVKRENVGQDWYETEILPDIAWIKQQASRCLDCGDPGCRQGCPLQNRIPDWLKLAAKGDIISAAKISHETSPLPEICGQLCPQHDLCEKLCTRNKLEGAVHIGKIEHAINKIALESGWSFPILSHKKNNLKKSSTVAVIGAGPSGLACAQRLIQNGVAVTVYDQNDNIGGLLVTAIPSFKLNKRTLAHRQALFEEAGVVFRLGQRIDEGELEQIKRQNDLIYVATGAQAPNDIELPGSHLSGVHQAIDFLSSINTSDSPRRLSENVAFRQNKAKFGEKAQFTDVNEHFEPNFNAVLDERCVLGQPPKLSGKKVVILGGGDTAMDSARCAVRLGAKSVQVVYRKSQQQMRASLKEQHHSLNEGVQFIFNHQPLEIIGVEWVTGVSFKTQTGEKTIAADQVIYAFGFFHAPPVWLSRLGVATNQQNRISINKHGRTSNDKVFAGGDNTHGADLVVTAVAAGLRAADAMIEQLKIRSIKINVGQ